MDRVANRWRVALSAQIGILLLTLPAGAQWKVGQFSTHLTGTVAPGYSAEYGNQTSSSHSWAIAGTGTVTGNYYNPNFVSYNGSFYLNQSRANSNFQSITNASGFDFGSTIFGGSHFPGSVNYSRAYNSQGNYGVPGLTDYVTHGNSSTFGINWSENLPDAPGFSAGYQSGSSQYSVYGSNDQGESKFHSLNLHSSYKLAGFNLGAYYAIGGSHSLVPQLVSAASESEIQSSNHAAGANVSHPLPLQGSISAGYNRSNWSSSYLGYTSKGTINLINGLAAVHPTEKLSLTVNTTYSDNLSGQLIESVVGAGGLVPGLNSNEKSNSFDVMAVATYAAAKDLQSAVSVERRTQTFLGETYGVTSWGGSASYLRTLAGGTFAASGNVIENLNDQSNENTLGFATSASYSRVLTGWHVNGSFSYSQNVQTLLITYMNSFYSYTFSARRNWGKFNVNAGTGSSRTGLTEVAGTVSSSNNYNAGVGYGSLISLNGSYSNANGQAITTGGGLIPSPIPSPVLPSSLVSLYGGHSYSLGISSSPVKKLVIAASYGASFSNISSLGVASQNQNNQFNTIVQYQTRKLSYSSGYARLEQGFSQSGLPPGIVSSYFAGVSRWFNFF
jgi:hypothetical protein